MVERTENYSASDLTALCSEAAMRPLFAAYADAAAAAAAAHQQEEVQEAEERAVFDAKKVDSIKEAIQNGSYPLDSRKIAENFMELEKLI